MIIKNCMCRIKKVLHFPIQIGYLAEMDRRICMRFNTDVSVFPEVQLKKLNLLWPWRMRL